MQIKSGWALAAGLSAVLVVGLTTGAHAAPALSKPKAGNAHQSTTITRSDKKFSIKCDGDFANQDTTIECSDETCDNNTVSGMYSLKYLNIFTKATGMCSTVQILQEQENRFLVLKYNVANLGELKFYLATKVDN